MEPTRLRMRFTARHSPSQTTATDSRPGPGATIALLHRRPALARWTLLPADELPRRRNPALARPDAADPSYPRSVNYNARMSLFAELQASALRRNEPLAARMRPRSLDEFVGQEAFLAPGKPLRQMIEVDRLGTVIFYGPPGSGKTALAHVIAHHTHAAFESLHAADAGVKEVRAICERARQRLEIDGRRTILFLDEIHRFNRAQQDALLRDVENGLLILIGATTENPFFSVNGPLISRGRIFQFQPLTRDHVQLLCRRALGDAERGLASRGVAVDDDALALIADHAGGDARRALNNLELAVLTAGPGPDDVPRVTRDAAAMVVAGRVVPHDRQGDAHYDVVSAFIKSMRGSDPDASVYWLARMIEAGEDPMFIARRIAICASEDVGNADPQAAVLGAAALQITHAVGLPECRYALAQAAIYVACSPKSNAVTRAIQSASEDVRGAPPIPVPAALRDASYAGAAALGHGRGYRYPHDYPGAVVQADLGVEKSYYQPTDRGDERRLADYLAWARRVAHGSSSADSGEPA